MLIVQWQTTVAHTSFAFVSDWVVLWLAIWHRYTCLPTILRMPGRKLVFVVFWQFVIIILVSLFFIFLLLTYERLEFKFKIELTARRMYIVSLFVGADFLLPGRKWFHSSFLRSWKMEVEPIISSSQVGHYYTKWTMAFIAFSRISLHQYHSDLCHLNLRRPSYVQYHHVLDQILRQINH